MTRLLVFAAVVGVAIGLLLLFVFHVEQDGSDDGYSNRPTIQERYVKNPFV
jgi:hypothetical protein